jgi:hypothetical protein
VPISTTNITGFSHLDPGIEFLQGIDCGVGEDRTVEQPATPTDRTGWHIVVARRADGSGRLKLLRRWH